jgi:hypothetical protein
MFCHGSLTITIRTIRAFTYKFYKETFYEYLTSLIVEFREESCRYERKMLQSTRLGRRRRKIGGWCLRLSEDAVQCPKFEFRIVTPKIRSTGLVDINLMGY